MAAAHPHQVKFKFKTKRGVGGWYCCCCRRCSPPSPALIHALSFINFYSPDPFNRSRSLLSFPSSCSPALVPLLPQARSLVCVCPFAPRSLVRACLGPLIRACSCSCPFVWCPFALVCPHMSRLFVLVPVFIWPSFMLICACSVVCPFSLHVASVRAHLCLYQVYG